MRTQAPNWDARNKLWSDQNGEGGKHNFYAYKARCSWSLKFTQTKELQMAKKEAHKKEVKKEMKHMDAKEDKKMMKSMVKKDCMKKK